MGYPEPVEVQQAAYGHLGDHTHPFAVQALVLEGIIELEISGKVQTYRAGDVFHLGYEQLHSEAYGPEGVRYLASRKRERIE
jgi:quercetin dioxygenase-like cupin family protein